MQKSLVKINRFWFAGTCMGFEVLQVLQANENILSRLVSNDKALPLNFLDAAWTSRLFKGE